MDVLAVVAEPHRRKMLQMVWDAELSASEIAAEFEITFGAVSQHLSVLREADFVTVRRDGNRRFYRTNQDNLGPLKQVLLDMWSTTLDALAEAAEADDD